MKKSNEAFWWSLFSAGGVMSALFLPAFVLITGLLVPAIAARRGPRATYEHFFDVVSWWPVRLLLFGVIFLMFFHAAHRIRHVLMDLGWRHHDTPLSVLCYGGAITGAGMAAWVLATFPGGA